MTVAILESVGYAIADAIERMENAGCVIKRIRTTGKQALSPIWTQIKSDILGRPVEVPEIRESELWGGALFSMKAVSNRDLTFLSHEKTRVGQTYYPDSKKHLLYKELLSMFQSLYPANKPLFAQWARIDFARGPTTQRD
jgi:sugar (pentulose or hexulose) kinase